MCMLITRESCLYLNTKIMSMLLLFFTFLFLNLPSQIVFSALPNCSDEIEVENYLRSPQYLSLYALNANLTKLVVNTTQKALENQDLSLKLDEILPNDTSKYLSRRPPKFCNRPAKAVFHLTLVSLDSINESDMTFVLDFWLTIAWYDTRLRFPKISSRDVRLLDVNWLDSIWKPDVIIINAREITVLDHIVKNQALKMLRDQVMVLYAKITTKLTCSMSFEKYPHDVQICDMKMESRNYPCIRIVFQLERSLRYHMIHTYIPSGSVVILSWITFWMKAEAIAARFGLGVTSLLTLVTLNSQSQKDLPPESYAKAVDIWMMSCALFVFGSIIEFAIVNYLVCRFTENAGENIIKSQETGQFFRRIRAVFTNEKIQAICHNIDRVSRVFFPLCFVVLNFWYWNTFVF